MRTHLHLSLKPSRLCRVLLLGALIGSAAACGEPPPPKPAGPSADAIEMQRIAQSDKLISDANRELSAKRYDKARKILREAKALKIASQDYKIDELSEKVDKKHAKLWANEMIERLKQKECSGAFKDMIAQMDEIESEIFSRELRRLTNDESIACATSYVDEATVAGKYGDARAFLAAPNTKAILGPTAWKKLNTELEQTITEALRGQLTEEINEKHWRQAMEKIDGFVKKGDATAEQAATLMNDVRNAMIPELSAIITKAIGQRDADKTLNVTDALIKLARWEILTGLEAENAKDKALPPALFKKREALGAWVETQRLKIKPAKKAEKRWTHGKVMLYPASKIDGESKRDIPPTTEVWVIATAKDRSLVSETDPGNASVAELFEMASGWVPTDRLAAESTAKWLPPNDQLKNTRVWAAMRAPDPFWELGVVMDVVGNDISVKRVADDKIVKVTRKQVRLGVLDAGTKIFAYCNVKDSPAVIEELLTAGRTVPTVRIKCDAAGIVKEEFLAGIRAKPEQLPSTK